jgi:hypothetical protein
MPFSVISIYNTVIRIKMSKNADLILQHKSKLFEL